MGPLAAIKTALRRTFVVSDVATRTEFWWFAAIYAATASAMLYLDAQLWGWTFKNGANAYIFFHTFIILFTLPLTTAAIRRMQDLGLNGAFVLLLPILALVLNYNAKSIMFDWFKLNDIRVGHPESQIWLRSFARFTDHLIPLSWGVVGVLLLLPTRFAHRFSRNSVPNPEGTS